MAGINESATDVTATMNGVFKIEDETTDRLIIEAYDENESLVQSFNFDLSNLNLEKSVSVEFTEQFISLGDTDPYTVNFSVVNRPANTHLTAVSSNPSAFTVDTTSIESGSVDVTGIADGNGVLTVSVLDSSDNVIASGILPVSVNIEQQDYNIVWYTYSGRENPLYTYNQQTDKSAVTTRFSIIDKDLNVLPSADYTANGVIIDNNGQEIYSYECVNASTTNKNIGGLEGYEAGDLLSTKTQEEIEACKCIMTVTINETDYVFQRNFSYYV